MPSMQIQEFLQAILEGRLPMVSGEEGRKTVEIFTAIYRSQRDARPVKFPLAPEAGQPFARADHSSGTQLTLSISQGASAICYSVPG